MELTQPLGGRVEGCALAHGLCPLFGELLLSCMFARRLRGRSVTAIVGIETITMSAALVASKTETGVAPISAANAVKLSGPLEFAIET